VVRTPPPSIPDACEASSAPFFCDYVRRGLRADPALGTTQEERDRRVYQGGLTISTTLDPAVQAAAQQAVDQTVPRDNRVAAVEVVVQPGTGNVLAMAVNRGYGGDPARGQTKQPLPTTAAFQPGSTFKIFTLAAALEQGYGTGTSFFAPACYVSPLYRIGGGSGRQDGGGCADGFSNADPGEAGVYDMARGTWLSVNTYFIQLEERVGVRAVADMAVRLGVPAARLAGVGPNDGSLTIGTRVVSPLDMATAYATVAAHGLRCAPRWATSATDGNRRPLKLAAPPPCQQVLPARVADTVTSVLEGVVTQGTGKNAAIGRPAAGKTGTTEGYSSAWYVGYTPDLVAAVEVGDPRGPVRYPLRDVTAAGQTYAQVYGGDLPALIWSRSIAQALADRPVTDFAAADPSVAAGTRGGSVDGAAPGGDYGRPGRGFPGGGTGGGGTGGGGTERIDTSGSAAAGSTTAGSADGTGTAAGTLGWGNAAGVEDFDDGSLSNWSVYDGPGHAGNGRRSPAAMSVSGGILTITGDANGITGGMAWRLGCAKYGRWEARV
ncbi:MAG TPA: penicillin-binding transpeptidase domain-containing protein, partial [Frankiaceae bacterium]|nr:penicillin-binding transpeptidase domain-containing protein [Frankiaceae bacterium]